MEHIHSSPHNFFTAYSLERLDEQCKDPTWVAAQLTRPEARFLPVWRMQNLMADATHPALLTSEEAAPFLPQAESVTILGRANGLVYISFALPPTDLPDALNAYGTFRELRSLAVWLSALDGGLLAYARAMAHWHHQQRFCGVCGHPTDSTWGGHLRRCSNPLCCQQHFPRTDPAIIVCTTCGERVLLGRKPEWTKGRYSNIAGFVAPGESLEDAVIREVQEETGARVVAVQYHSSQPWPFPGSLMIGFTATAADDTLCTGPGCSDGELEDFRWFTRAEIRRGLENGTLGLPSRVSISFRLIEDWFDAGDQGHLAPLKMRYNPD
ncbi:MAG TPA: NAD(+) diphosphatase [Anaerolineae bacterium]|nr:NAD(+) diphosphatase [Anaerolineae bacterium]HQK14761.1 NAD(+) diphosphatase [Anaerolineae bacterium]